MTRSKYTEERCYERAVKVVAHLGAEAHGDWWAAGGCEPQDLGALELRIAALKPADIERIAKEQGIR